MTDLISRDAARNVINTWICNHNVVDRINFIHADLSALPSIDAAPVRHGEWEEVDDMWGDIHYRCSACGCEWFLEDGSPTENGMNYCPHCGARMDGRVDVVRQSN